MRRITLAALVAMAIGWGLPAAYAEEASSGVDRIEPPPHTTTSKSSLDTSASPPPAGKAASLQRRAAPDCAGVAPSAAAVPSLLSWLVRSSATARSVQCPMSPVPDALLLEELHP